jgi:xylan 1,4-beta-xylosidase
MKSKQVYIYLLGIVIITFGLCDTLMAQRNPVSISVDVQKTIKPLYPMWAYFGYDEPNYTYMKDGKKLLGELAAMSKVPVYIRAHSLLTTGDGKAALKWGSTNAYTEDASGNPIYNWAIMDSIFDTFIANGIKPIAEIGFTPEAMSTHPFPYQHHWKPGDPYNDIYTGWAYPPKDYTKWAELVYQWVKHAVQRYGEAEVKTWWWEVWNEPNIGYWKGTMEEYFMLYDFTSDAVKRACPTARVGGPATTGPDWNVAEDYLRQFLKHCAEGKNYATGKTGSPLDMISFHAKGSPKVVDGHVRMNMSPQLRAVAKGFEVVMNSAFKTLPIYITEFDPEGCAACGMTTNPENAYRNGTMYSSYTAASFTRLYDLADLWKVNLAGSISWSFEFENQPWFHGFRDLATHGIDKPVLNVFRMLGMMQGNRIEVQNSSQIALDSILKSSVRGSHADIHALASASTKTTSVMVWNYHDDDVQAEASSVTLTIKNIKATKVKLSQYRIDATLSNSYEAWKKMGSPQQVSDAQYKLLEKAGQLQLASKPEYKTVSKGEVVIQLTMPRQAVTLITLDY